MSAKSSRISAIIQNMSKVGVLRTVVLVQCLVAMLIVIGLLTPALHGPAKATTLMISMLSVVASGWQTSPFKHGVGVDELIAINNIINANIIVPGQRLILPGSRIANPYGARVESAQLPASNGYYTVQRGDSLSVIAHNFDMSLDDIMRLNGLGNPQHVWVGQQLRVTARVEPVIAELAICGIC
jgi:LysM repeat protein